MDNQNQTASVTTQVATDQVLQFPKKVDQVRLDAYGYYDKLYFGEHYDAFMVKGQKDFGDQYNRLRYVVANFAGLMSRVLADMLFSDQFSLDFESENNQKFMDALLADNQFRTQCYESALANSRRGDSIFKLRIGRLNNNPAAPPTVIIEEVTPAIYFPSLDISNNRYKPTEDVLAWAFTANGVEYLHKETHRPGYIFHEIYRYDSKNQKIIAQVNAQDFGFPDVEETKASRSLIFHVPNVRDGSGFWGTSDYKDLSQLFFALNNRITKIDNILDKHSDPILAVPPGVLDEEGKVKKEALGMFEVDNENGGFNKPEYIVWNANLDSAFKEVDALIKQLFMFSEIAPATMGMDEGGLAESGRALKFRLLSTIRKRNRKVQYYDQMIKDMLETVLELAGAWNISVNGMKADKPERPAIDWGDGVINDPTELVDMAVKRIEAGIESRSGAIVGLDNISEAEAKKKVAEIDDEDKVVVPAITNNTSQNVNGNNNGNMPMNGNMPANNNQDQKPNTNQGS